MCFITVTISASPSFLEPLSPSQLRYLSYTAESSLLDFGFSLICLDFYSLCRFLITFMISVFILNHTLVLTSSTLVYFKTIIACA